jgi:hypothetical protein
MKEPLHDFHGMTRVRPQKTTVQTLAERKEGSPPLECEPDAFHPSHSWILAENTKPFVLASRVVLHLVSVTPVLEAWSLIGMVSYDRSRSYWFCLPPLKI